MGIQSGTTNYPGNYDLHPTSGSPTLSYVTDQERSLITGLITVSGTLIRGLQVNSVYNSVQAIEQTLGINPQGIFASVSDRFIAIGSSGVGAGLYVPISGGTMYGDLIMSGANILPETSGIGNLGSSIKYFDTLFVNHISGVTLSVSGNFVLKTGDTMTGSLLISGATLAVGQGVLALGTNSTAFGLNTVASGSYSHAEGLNNFAYGDFGSHVEGQSNTASGTSSHAEGNVTKAFGFYSHAEGHQTIAIGTGTHAEGYFTTANSNFSSHAEGGFTTAVGDYSHAEGIFSVASGTSSHAEGHQTIAVGTGTHAEGYFTTALVDYSHAEGNNTVASGESSHAEGKDTVAFGIRSHAEGELSKALGSWTHAEGFDTIASGTVSHAEGFGSVAGAGASHAEGLTTKALGENSHSQGSYTIASGLSSFAAGWSGNALHDYSIVFADMNGATSTATNQFTLGFTNGVSLTNGTSILNTVSGVNNLGSTALPFSGVYALSVNDRVIIVSKVNEVPTGNISSGTNPIFTLSQIPYGTSLSLFKNGLLTTPSGLYAGISDYVLSGSTITFDSAPISGSILLATYGYQA